MAINEILLYRALGEQLKNRRKQRGKSQTDVAQAVGIERTSITNIEKGRQKTPLHVLYGICDYLGFEARDLMPIRSEVTSDDDVTIKLDGEERKAPPKVAEAAQRMLKELGEEG